METGPTYESNKKYMMCRKQPGQDVVQGGGEEMFVIFTVSIVA